MTLVNACCMGSVPWSTAGGGGELPSWIAPRESDGGHSVDSAPELECFRPTPVPSDALPALTVAGGTPLGSAAGGRDVVTDAPLPDLETLLRERDQLRGENDALAASLRVLAEERDRLKSERDGLARQHAMLGQAVGVLRQALLVAGERELVRLSLVVAERIVHHEVGLDPAVVTRWAQACVDALAARDAYSLAVSPELERLVPRSVWTDAHGVPHPPVVDATLSGLSCQVRTEFGRIEVGLRARLAAMAEVLGVDGVEQP